MSLNHNFQSTTKLYYFLFLWLCGILLGDFFVFSPQIFFVIFGLSLFISLFFKADLKILFLFYSIFFVGIFWRQIHATNCFDDEKLCYYNNSQIELVGEVLAVKEKLATRQLIVKADFINIKNIKHSVEGLVLINQQLFPHYYPGDILHLKLKPSGLEELPSVGYRNYLMKEGIFSLAYQPQIILLDHHNNWRRVFFQFRQATMSRLKRTVKEPTASLLNAIILNETGGLSKKINDGFSRLGLTHIVAISGGHLVIIISILSAIFFNFGWSRKKSGWLVVLLIFFYIILVGAPASAVRSGLMAFFLLSANYFGYLPRFGLILLWSASIMALINPLVLLFDVGFQLSFMAVFGLAYLSKIVSSWLFFLPDWRSFKEIIVSTISAQIATLPLIMFHFGSFSLWSLLANLLILPSVPLLMILSLLNFFVLWLSFSLSVVLGFLNSLIIGYWLLVIDFLVNWHSFSVESGNFIFLLFYLPMIYVIIKKNKKSI